MLTLKKKLAPTWFQLPGEDPAPEVLLAPLTTPGWIDVRNEITQTGQGDLSITGKGALIAARTSVVDWRNVVDEHGQPLKFRRDLLEDLPRHLLMLIASQVVERATLSESERKNS